MAIAGRVVLDTNVVLSALVFTGGSTAKLRQGWQLGRFLPLASTGTAQELIKVLGYPKFRLSHAEQRELLADYLPYCTTVRPPRRSPEIPVCRDPYDIPFLQLAMTGKAHTLVTGDKDLLALADQFGCSILTPDRFLESMNGDR